MVKFKVASYSNILFFKVRVNVDFEGGYDISAGHSRAR